MGTTSYWNKFLSFLGLAYEEERTKKEDQTQKNNLDTSSKVVDYDREDSATAGELCLYSPTNFEEAKKIVDDLKQEKPVVLNLDNLEKEKSHRFLDFISGAIYGIEGDIKKVSQKVFIFIPKNVKINGKQHIKTKKEMFQA